MPIDPNIALSFRGMQVADPLAQYGQVQNILAAQTQQQASQLHMQQVQRQIQQDDNFITKMSAAITNSGGPPNIRKAAELLAAHPQHSQYGMALLQSLARRDQAIKEGIYGPVPDSAAGPSAPAAAAGPSSIFAAPSTTDLPTYDNTTLRAASDSIALRQAALETPVTARAPVDEAMELDYIKNAPPGVTYEDFAASQNTGVTKPVAARTPVVTAPLQASGMIPAPVINNLPAAVAPAITTVANNLVPAVAPTPALAPIAKADSLKALREEYTKLSQYDDQPGIKDRMALIRDQIKEKTTPRVVGRNLVTGEGDVIYSGPHDIAPSETARLIAERKALFDKNPKDPNIAVYDQQIKDISLARDTLNFNKEVQQWKVNHPGYSIQQDENGYLVGVNPNTLQGTYVTFGQPSAGGGKPGKPGVFPAANVQGKPSVLPPAAATQTAPGAAPAVPTDGMPALGERMKGKSTGLTEGQSNAAMFGSAMAQAQQVFDKAERDGTTTGAGTVNLAQGIVKYVPLGIGDKLVNDIYALAVNDPTKLFGPDVNQQKIGQAQLAFAIAYLRKTSGANFGPSEVANTIMEYFPSVGEDEAVVKQKAESRKRAIAGMKMSAGREGAKFIEQYESGKNKNVITNPNFPGFSIGTK